jgi:hypothetical protein
VARGANALINPRRWSLNSALLYSAKQANIGALSGILLKTLIGHRDGHDGLADKTVRMRKVDGGPDSGNPFVVQDQSWWAFSLTDCRIIRQPSLAPSAFSPRHPLVGFFGDGKLSS